MKEIYEVSLKNCKKAPRNFRARKCINILKEKLKKEIKREFHISRELNENIWKRGIQKPPEKIKIRVVEEEGKLWLKPKKELIK